MEVWFNPPSRPLRLDQETGDRGPGRGAAGRLCSVNTGKVERPEAVPAFPGLSPV